MTLLIAIMLTILCICSLVLAAGVTIIAFLLSNSLNKDTAKGAAVAVSPAPSSPYSPEQLERMRKQSEDEIKAFQELMNYSADVAYGIKRGGDDE